MIMYLDESGNQELTSVVVTLRTSPNSSWTTVVVFRLELLLLPKITMSRRSTTPATTHIQFRANHELTSASRTTILSWALAATCNNRKKQVVSKALTRLIAGFML